MDENIRLRCAAIEAMLSHKPAIVYHKGEREFYLPSSDILFFETDGEAVYAHSKSEMYSVTYRLYQLEELLPNEFVRISKSTVANTSQIMSLTKTLPSSVSVQFFDTHKQVHVSRHYYKQLKEKLSNRR
ncbi:MAG: LytTR family transcriptional regulator [Oscillospiraceae bacterium]|nr:LytTR family transcriptional regulator [Oscillospiraceae bacterium]MCL2213528.1 LytTR family transcriptional regulator [Oscillospiraceae bacterium]